jgi:hypothetical protein
VPELEQRLRLLAAEAAWPATPDLAGAVVAALPSAPVATPRPRLRLPRRRLALALVAAMLLLPAAALALPGPRHAILDALGLRHVRIERRATPPRAYDPKLGRLVSLARATHAGGFTATYPAALGPPDRAYLLGAIVSYVYDKPHVLLAQAVGDVPQDVVLHKVLSVDQTARRVRVGGRPGVWLPEHHAYEWSDATGPLVRSGTALVWERGDRTLRLEGARTLAQALRIARSVP